MLLMKILILGQQLHILQLHKLLFATAHFNFTTAQIVINCTLKYALDTTLSKLTKQSKLDKYCIYDAKLHTYIHTLIHAYVYIHKYIYMYIGLYSTYINT